MAVLRDERNNNLTYSESFKSKTKVTGKTPNIGNTKDVEIIVPLKYLSNFWRTIEIPLINCEFNFILTWPSTCVITNFTGAGRFAITDTKLYVPVLILSTLDNAKFPPQLNSGFKRTINWNKYPSHLKTYAQNQYLNHLVDSSFQGVNRLFVLSFENENARTSHSEYYLLKVGIKNYSVEINGKNSFDQPIDDDIKAYGNIRKIATDQGDDYTTGCLLDYPYFKEDYKMIPIDLSKQQALNADSRAIQQINFTANLDRAGNTTMVFFIEEAKETVLDFSQRTVKVY